MWSEMQSVCGRVGIQPTESHSQICLITHKWSVSGKLLEPLLTTALSNAWFSR